MQSQAEIDPLEFLEQEVPIVKDRVKLKQVSEKFNFKEPQRDPVELARLLTDKMDSVSGIGLSAIQIGIPLRVFAVRTEPRRVVFNPEIVHVSDETVELDEGCLSFPNMIVRVTRPQLIRIRYTLPNGDTDLYTYSDMTARVFQHECDHLNGILMFERVSRYHREKAFRQMEKRNRRFRE